MKRIILITFLLVYLSCFGSYQNMNSVREAVGNSISGMAVNATLYVDVNGDSTDGSNWTKAYTTIQGALDAASTDVNVCTLIMIGINTGNIWYDINTTGDPTWTGNYILFGTHRNWAKIKNTHASATSIMKFTGYVSLRNLNINLGTDTNGIIIEKGGFRIDNCMFVGEDLTGTATAITLGMGSVIKNGKIRNCDIKGELTSTYMTGIKFMGAQCCDVSDIRLGYCINGFWQVDDDSDNNRIKDSEFCSNDTTLNIDAGSYLSLESITFIANTVNIDDETKTLLMNNLIAELPVEITPDDFDGILLESDGTANTFGAAVTLIAADAIDVPFKVITSIFEPDTADKWYQVRLSADGGTTWFETVMFRNAKKESSNLPNATDFIFNQGTPITAEVKCEVGGDDTQIWIKLQEY